MSKKFPEYKGLDLPKVNDEVLKMWDDHDTFRKSLRSRDGKGEFVFYEGPPSANGMPGIHHVMSRAIKDTICRFRTLQGYEVKRKAGWDTHGLPVELGVEKTLGITKEDIGTKTGISRQSGGCSNNSITRVCSTRVIQSSPTLPPPAPASARTSSTCRDATRTSGTQPASPSSA